MILNEYYLIDYLLEKGYLSAPDILLDKEFVVKNHSQRSNCYSVEGREISLFLKQQPVRVDYKQQTFFNEAALYTGALKGLSIAPPLIFYDSEQEILCLEYLRHGLNLFDYFKLVNDYPVELARILAVRIKELHTMTVPASQEWKPWILNVHSEKEFGYTRKNETGRLIVGYVQSDARFSGLIRQVNELFRYDSLAHNDLKATNILLRGREAPGEMYVIDWEFARRGDRLFDLGTLLCSYLFYWSDQFNAIAYDRAFGFFRDLFDAYREISGIEERDYYERVVKYAGVRLIQSCLEASAITEKPFSAYHRKLQLSYNLLQSDNLLCKFFQKDEYTVS